jgi:hypothetical protein
MRVAVMNVYNPSIIFYNKAIAIFAAWLAVRIPGKRESERVAERNRLPSRGVRPSAGTKSGLL